MLWYLSLSLPIFLVSANAAISAAEIVRCDDVFLIVSQLVRDNRSELRHRTVWIWRSGPFVMPVVAKSPLVEATKIMLHTGVTEETLATAMRIIH